MSRMRGVQPSASTRLIALLGDPVAHSLSPRFQNAAIHAAGLDAVYLAIRCAAGELQGLLRGVAAAGGAGNVTVPHKERAAALIERPTEAVRATGACNTYWAEAGLLCGDNTDVAGVLASLGELFGRSPAGARVLLLGAGGAARAALYALWLAGAARVEVVNRTPERSAALVALSHTWARVPGFAPTEVRVAPELRRLAEEHFDLVINATSLGLNPADPLPLEPEIGPAFGAALDLVYAPQGTRWIRELRTRGIPADDGKTMLLHQGAAAFERWFGREAPLEVMREALSSLART